MKSIPQKYFTYLLVAALVITIYLLLSDSCSKQPVDHSVEKELIDSGDKVLRDSLDMYKRFLSEKTQVIAGQDSTIRNYRGIEQANKKELQQSKATALKLATELKNYRDMDTGSLYTKLDSLISETGNLAYLLNEYVLAVDSLTLAIDQQKSNYESLAAKRAELLTQMRTQYETVYKGYNNLFSTNQGLQKNLKRERLKTKIAAVIALVEGILLAVK